LAVFLLVRRFGDRLPLPSSHRVIGALLCFVVALPSLHLFGGWITPQRGAELALRGAGGGAAGWALLQALQSVLGNVGAAFALLLSWLAALMLFSEMTVASFVEQVRRMAAQSSRPLPARVPEVQSPRSPREKQADPLPRVVQGQGSEPLPAREPDLPLPRSVREKQADPLPRVLQQAQESEALPTRVPDAQATVLKINTPASRQGELNRVPPPRVIGTESRPADTDEADDEGQTAAGATEHASQGQSSGKQPTAPAVMQREWTLPTLEDMLEPGSDSTLQESDIRERAALIEETLLSFGVPGRVTEVNRGPTITQFGVEPGFVEMKGGKTMKVKVGRIAALADDLALALAAPRIRIEAPVPGRAIVGIEVPNGETALVSLRDVIESEPFEKLERKSRLALAFGQDVSGHPVVADLAEMPHLLIAGTTGSGKSVCVNGIIIGLLCNNTPDDVRFLMIDPKRVELTGYNGVPHLISPVIVDVDKAPSVLKWTMREMDTRYKTFAKLGVRNIVEYNARVAADGTGSPEARKLPYIVLVVDELADLMMMSPEDTERAIVRLAQMARATGIHLILATQRPSVDVVTGLIKANFPARIAFTVATAVDSRVILDGSGAEKLLGRGDMLAMMPGSSAAMRAQGCYLSPKEIERVVRHWSAQAAVPGVATPAAPAAPAVLVDAPGESGASAANDVAAANSVEPAALVSEDEPATSDPYGTPPTWDEARAMAETASDKDDKLFNDAVNAVRFQGKASISLLQRRLRIGYTRAARLIEEMEERGIVGPTVPGQQHREVL
jgi:S-DNA-T family DNA segregation ATPase FtsK/SpoIIIE